MTAPLIWSSGSATGMLLGYIPDSVMTIGLSINRCSHSKKNKNSLTFRPPPASLSRKIGDFSWGEGGVCTLASTLATLANSPLYSYKWKRGWSWPCFDTTLLALLCKSCSSYANYYFLSIMIKKRTRFVSKQGQPHPHICTTLSPGLFTHFLREKPWGRGWYLYKGLDKRPTTVK